MGIQELSIKGFRSLRDVTWRPGKLNVVIGPNGSGKSNLLQAIELLRTSAVMGLSDAILRLGGIAPLLWDGRVQAIDWGVKIGPVTDASSQAAFEYALCLSQLGVTSSYRIELEQLVVHSALDPEQPPTPWTLIRRTPTHAALFGRDGTPVEREAGLFEHETLLSAASFGSPVAWGFREILSGWSLYHDIHVDRSAPLRQAAVARMERVVAADGQNLIPVLHTLYTSSRDFKRTVDAAMRVAFGSDYEELVFPPAADQRVQLRVRWRSLRTEQSAANLSDGTVRFLLLLAILANPSPPDLIIFDEPETGLHPSMLPIVAEHAADAALRSQVIFTTHSPQLLDAFTATLPTTTVARWEEGETRLSVIDGEELARWLHEYSLGALFRSGELEGMA